MTVKPVALVGLMGASAVLALQETAFAIIKPIKVKPTSIDCDAVAQRERGGYVQSPCTTSRQESIADFELTDLVRSVEFSNRKQQSQIGIAHELKVKTRKGLSSPQPDSLAYLVEGTRDI